MSTQYIEAKDGSVLWIENGMVRSYGAHPDKQKTSFAPANLGGVRYGAYSDRIVKDRAPEVLEQLVAMYPMVMQMPTNVIERYCLVEARLSMLYEEFMRLCEVEGIQSVPPTLNAEISKAEQNSLNYAKAIGMTVESWAGIAKNMGFARHFSNERVGDLASEGRKIREAQGRLKE